MARTPIRKSSNQEYFISIVNEIIENKSQKKDTSFLENQIDILIYKLYNLTYQEVLIIDPAFSLTQEAYEQYEIE